MSDISKPIGQSAGDAILSIFGQTKVVIGVVHLAAAPRRAAL